MSGGKLTKSDFPCERDPINGKNPDGETSHQVSISNCNFDDPSNKLA